MDRKVQSGPALHNGSSAPEETKMIVGFILEGGPSGPDKRVCELLVERLRPGTEVLSVTLGPKQNLISQCGEVASTLFQKGCDCIIIVWDLYPAWGVHRA